MAQPTTLSEYYSSQGQALPSVSARQGLAAQAGIQGYTGTAQQNIQLLGYLGKNQGATPPTIPVNQALGSVPPANLPNRPQEQEPTNVTTSAGAYLASLPKTGVAGLDQITQAMVERPGQLAQEYDIANKQALAKEAQYKYDKFNEEYRVKQERIRTEGGRTLEQINQEVNAIERTRAFQAGTLAIEAAYRSGDFQGAKELMNQQIALELEPMKMKYQFFKDLYDRTEDQKFQRAMRNEERAYQTAKENLSMLNDVKMQLLKDGRIDAASLGSINSWEDLQAISGFTKADAMTIAQANQTINNIDEALKNTGGLAGAVGPRGIARRGLFRPGKVQTFIGNVEQIAGQLTIDKLIQAKSSGATFGALSDSEQRLLAASASRLGSWAIKDKGGNITGYRVPESEIKKELQKIKDFAILDYEKRTGLPYSTVNDPIGIGIDITEYDPAGLFQQ